jgi:hypothetical protein
MSATRRGVRTVCGAVASGALVLACQGDDDVRPLGTAIDSGIDGTSYSSSAASDAALDGSADTSADGADGAGEGEGGQDATLGDAAADGGSGDGGDGGSDASPPTFAQECDGASTMLEGIVYTPGGGLPVPNALVYAAAQPLSWMADAGPSCLPCTPPSEPVLASTLTRADGSFALSLDSAPASATTVLAIQLGGFHKVTASVAVTACAVTTVATSATTLPGTIASGDVPKIAVASGDGDHLEQELTNLGIGFDCYAPADAGTCEPIEPIADLLVDSVGLGQYGELFLSSSAGAFAALLPSSQAAVTANLQSWVQSGGRLVATDEAYDYVAQAFPQYITWLGDGGVDGANEGCAPAGGNGMSPPAVTYSATIDDTTLQTWLYTGIHATNALSGPVSFVGFSQPWAVIASLPSGMSTPLAEALMPVAPGPEQCTPPSFENVPLAARFDVNACGRVEYSSVLAYTGPGSASGQNEHLLDYMILQSEACSGP